MTEETRMSPADNNANDNADNNTDISDLVIVGCGIAFYMLHNTLQTHGTQMAPEARGSALALFALCLFVGQAIGVPVAAPIVDRWGAVPIFWAAALFLPALGCFFAISLRRRRA